MAPEASAHFLSLFVVVERNFAKSRDFRVKLYVHIPGRFASHGMPGMISKMPREYEHTVNTKITTFSEITLNYDK